MPDIMDSSLARQALLIRKVEEILLRLFREGRTNGTVHTCIGQELSALAFCRTLEPRDAVFTNHRGHGHFLARTGDYRALIGETMGRRSGVCGGVGGSQHLKRDTFYSNGIQGGIVPVAAGLAMARKLRGEAALAVAFIGDGTWGEGVVYETLNIVAKWQLPLLLVVENNGYAQSTPATRTQAGSLADRARAFGLPLRESSTNDPAALLAAAADSVRLVRDSGTPLVHLVETYRLGPHSAGDDLRDPAEVARARAGDPLNRFLAAHPELRDAWEAEIEATLAGTVAALDGEPALDPADYLPAVTTEPVELVTESLPPAGDLLIRRINAALQAALDQHDAALVLGEDVLSPYGGAFKATRGLSDRHPGRVFSTPISEAAIVGIANGLALEGLRPIAEIMFGDFITLAFDQLLNHASKFQHMYNGQARCPIVVRTPMGGGRGFGPTHSQSLEKFLTGMDNVTVVALNRLIDPGAIYQAVLEQASGPVIVIEHKVDYARRLFDVGSFIRHGYRLERTTAAYPTLRLRPTGAPPDLTLITYGGMVGEGIEAAERLFAEQELLAEIIIPTRLHPLPVADLATLVGSPVVVTVEEGSVASGIGAEIVAALAEATPGQPRRFRRIGAQPVAIPAAKELERMVLPSADLIVAKVSELFHG